MLKPNISGTRTMLSTSDLVQSPVTSHCIVGGWGWGVGSYVSPAVWRIFHVANALATIQISF